MDSGNYSDMSRFSDASEKFSNSLSSDFFYDGYSSSDSEYDVDFKPFRKFVKRNCNNDNCNRNQRLDFIKKRGCSAFKASG